MQTPTSAPSSLAKTSGHFQPDASCWQVAQPSRDGTEASTSQQSSHQPAVEPSKREPEAIAKLWEPCQQPTQLLSAGSKSTESQQSCCWPPMQPSAPGRAISSQNSNCQQLIQQPPEGRSEAIRSLVPPQESRVAYLLQSLSQPGASSSKRWAVSLSALPCPR